MTPIAVVTTVASRAEAQTMAHALVERRLAACVQISEIESVYRWQGQVHQDPECRLVIKTTRERYAALEQALRAGHPYELPEIIAVPIERGLPAYLQWVAGETQV